VNVVVWLETARRQRKPLLTARLLHVKGVLERQGDIVHVMAGRLSDLSHLIRSLPVHARNFH
jgi:error-prone DNA polymerase